MKSDTSLAGLTVAERRKLLSMARARDLVRGSELPPIEPAPREGRVPLSFAQQRLWFLEQLGNLGSTYHITRRHRLRGALDRAALVRALDRIVARHEALRTTFAQVDGVPEQCIAPAETSRFHLVEHDLADDLPLSARDERGVELVVSSDSRLDDGLLDVVLLPGGHADEREATWSPKSRSSRKLRAAMATTTSRPSCCRSGRVWCRSIR